MSVLRYLAHDENAVITLLRALCALKPLREALVRLFTQGNFGADDVEFEGISTQFDIGGAIPDVCLQTGTLRVVVEIKVSEWRGSKGRHGSGRSPHHGDCTSGRLSRDA
jgi:hypothetical protein